MEDTILQEIVRRIVEKVKPTSIYLFGSRARGDHDESSDYDIALIYDGEKSKREIKIESRHVCWGINASIDIVVLTSDELNRFKTVATTLAREISESGVIVHG